jgi:hypothetical protein
MTSKFLHLVLAIGCLASCAFGQDAASDVHVRLSPIDSRKTYQIGEPIKLLLEFTADRDGYQVNRTPYTSESIADTISVSPDSGVSRWRRDYFGLGSECVVSYAKLSNDPTRIEFVLNDSVAFNQPGRYTISVTTRRVSQLPRSDSHHLSVTSNEISLVIEAMSEADEQKQVETLSNSIDSTTDPRIIAGACAKLNFLTGDQSSREKVRRFIGSEARPCVDIYTGLFNARNRALMLQLLEGEFRDETTPVTSVLLGALTKMRMIRERAGAPFQPGNVADFTGTVDPRTTEIQDAYVAELAAGLSKRAGKSQTTTAMTVLALLPKEVQTRDAMLREVRTILLQNFDRLHSYEQEYLMRQYWEQLRDPSLVPSLKKMLDSTGIASKNIHDSALKRLIEIAPSEARPYVIAELRDPTSFVDLEIAGSVADKTLPEADAALAEQIRRFAALKVSFDRVYLRHKTQLAARFASDAIYQDLMQTYRDAASTIPMDSRAGFLAYFARYNEPEALALLEQALAGAQPGEDLNLLPDFTRAYFSDGVNALLLKRLESEDPRIASTAAYLISLRGGAQDRGALEARLARWRTEWSGRAAEADTNLQSSVEIELISALTRGKSWKLTPEREKELQLICVTKRCKQNFRVQ